MTVSITRSKTAQALMWPLSTHPTPTHPVSSWQRHWDTLDNIKLYLVAGVAQRLQELFNGLEPQHPSHPPIGVEPWDIGDLITEETHTSPENKGHFFSTQQRSKSSK